MTRLSCVPGCLVLLLSALLGSASAQRQPVRSVVTLPPLSSTNVRLQIELVDENSRRVARQALVEVTGGGVTNLRGYTTQDGTVDFTARQGVSYRVRASAPGLESDETSFEIQPGEMFHHEMLRVKLKDSPNATKPAQGGLISADQLNVPDKAKKEYQKGMEAIGSKKWDKAREHFAKAIKEYPQFDWAYNNMGVAAMQERDVAAAKEAFQRAVQINDHNPAATRNLGRIYLANERNPQAARGMLLKSLTADPRSSETMTLLAFADLQVGDIDGALSTARKVHSNGPQDQFPLAHLIAGRALERKGEKDAAAEQYRAYLTEAQNTADAKVAKEGLARLGMK